ncbi:MAG TPA: AIR synthase-related protein [Micromonosporaceae bacterium]|jgi:phosphoribosylformylglycinamidine cyclo-ligase
MAEARGPALRPGGGSRGGVYESAGVDYDLLDAGKRHSLAQALLTSGLAASRGARALDASRGEPAFLFALGGRHLAMVLECLGTKSVIARQYQELTGVNRFDWVGIDTVAAVVNDLICVGALPLTVNAYFATGAASWYHVAGRHDALTRGFREGCERAGAIWGGGESPTLTGIIDEDEIDLAACGVGQVPAGREPLLSDAVEAGDEIVLVASTGLHTNGATLARLAADRAGGLATTLSDGTTVGDALLTPSAIYVDLMDQLLHSGLTLSYASHITGHGLRKVMRPDRELSYRITQLPPVPPVLDWIRTTLGLADDEAYGTFNMGAGFAVYCRPGQADAVVAIAARTGHDACLGGRVETGARRVILEPVGVTFGSEELKLR